MKILFGFIALPLSIFIGQVEAVSTITDCFNCTHPVNAVLTPLGILMGLMVYKMKKSP